MRQTNCKKKFGRITTVLCMVLLLVSVAGLFVSCGQDDETGGSTKQTYTSLEDFRDKRIGVLTGTIQGAAVEKQFPQAELSYFNTHSDLLEALRQDKIDAFADSDIIIRYMMIENSDLTYFDEHLTESVLVGAIFGKNEQGNRLRDQFNEFLKKSGEDGTLDEIDKIWYGSDNSVKKVEDPASLPAKNGVLKLATDTGNPPVSYRGDDQIIGIDIDIVTRFCKAYGYGLEIEDMSFPVIVNAVATGKCDFGAGGIGITAERAESVNFSDTMYEGNSVFAYIGGNDSGSEGVFSSIKESFEKTFIRECRWKLFVQGIGVTMLITVLSILFGTLLGSLVFLACRRGNRIANGLTWLFTWLVNGMPVVVLLMVLYYIVFGSVQISGTIVSIIAFTLIFGSTVYALLKSGVAAVDIGQTEAAYALGYTDRQTFFRIVLPQALTHIMPSYKGSITALIKATAVVGYIAVEDLTKMGDIIRSRTYEAFFPLIAVAIVYFILAAVLIWIVNRVEPRFFNKKRRPEDILKGINTEL